VTGFGDLSSDFPVGVYVSPYVPKGTAYFMPAPFVTGNPIIVTDSIETVVELLRRHVETEDQKFLHQCGIISNIGEP
jgi:hypothetical protein